MEQNLSIYRSPYPLIYVYEVQDGRHGTAKKIGMTNIKLSQRELMSIDPCGIDIEKEARRCIKDQTNRSATKGDYLYSELAFFFDEDGEGYPFTDKYVHMILRQNGFEKKDFPDMEGNPQEWYICELEDVKEAIRTIKAGRNVMRRNKSEHAPIVFREEQDRAIQETIEQFKVGDQMLWNAKMRFGKTLCSLELVRRQGYSKTLIVTHRPAVRAGWFDDYDLLPFKGYEKGSKLAEMTNQKNPGETFATLQREYNKNGTKYIYFASMQDLRGGSDAKEGGIDKNHEIFADNWDLIIVDEAHEGTQTSLGKNVLYQLMKRRPKVLYLSGTPYNILHKFSNKEIFTWDYNMEQRAKENWYIEHPGEPNDYAELPRMNIRTFRLRDNFEKYYKFDEDYFNFGELFRTWTGDESKDAAQLPSPAHKGKFVHEDDIRAYLNLMHQEGALYPFSTEEYRELFAHTFWVVPGVKEAKALSAILQEKESWWQDETHKYQIVNVAGDGDDPIYDRNESKEQVEKREKKEHDALEKVKQAIANNDRTITISCGRLTTGVTVKPWTGVFMLKGNGDTKAAFYMQTIFRAQSPCKEPFKTDCYAFDFAPDRTLTVIDEYLSSQPNNKDRKKRPKETVIKEFLNFCSVISIDGSSTTTFDEKEFINQVNRAYKECIIRQGFKGRQLYVDLYQLSDADKALLETIDEVIKKGGTKGSDGKVKVNEGGVNTKDGKKKKKQIQTTKNKNANAERKKLRDRYQLILDTLSVRLPMMVFGEVESLENFDMEDFVNRIEESSWEVFMPRGVTRELFKSLLHLYNTDAILASFNDIITQTHNADELPIAQRAQKIAELLATFRFPDKETVLTPWNVVNLHMTNTIGGYDFYDEKHDKQLIQPRFVKQDVTDDIFGDKQSHILEINAKSGVYPLWLAYTFYQYRENEYIRLYGTPPKGAEQEIIWRTILRENIFVLCMSPMAVKITERALRGYLDYETNCKYQPELLTILKDETDRKVLIENLQTPEYWGIENMEPNKFKFKAVVGNPPYQGDASAQLYPHFYLMSRDLGKYSSLIFPTGWQKPCSPSAKGLARLNSEEIKADPQIRNINVLHNVFPGVSGASEVNIVFWERGFQNELGGEQLIYQDGQNPQVVQLQWDLTDIERPAELKSLAAIVRQSDFVSSSSIVSSRSPYGLNTDAFEDAQKNGLEEIVDSEPRQKDDIKIYGKFKRVNTTRYVRKSYELPTLKEEVAATINKYKVFIPYAWGNMSENAGLGGAYGDIIIGKPQEICTQTYIVSGCFDTKVEAVKHAKYVLTQFARALLYIKKMGRTSAKPTWEAVPVQDYSEPWWKESVEQINEHLFDKYDVPQDIRDYVKKHIQPRSEENIRNI